MRHARFIVVASGLLWVSGGQAQSSNPPEAATENFATLKADLTERLQKELACVDAATTREALQACMPHPAGNRMGPPPGVRP